MRAHSLRLAATCSAAIVTATACSGGTPSGDDRPRGGELMVARSTIAGFEPEHTLTGVGQFFAPPGPATPEEPPVNACTMTTPEPAPTPTPEATQEITWRDAGDTLTLRSTGTVLELEQFNGAEGQILYIAAADAEPAALEYGATYDVEIEGTDIAGGVPPALLEQALRVPPAVGLYAPDFDVTPAELSRSPLQVGWNAEGDGEEPVQLRMTVTGSAGTATLACAIRDVGFYEISSQWLEAFPAGGGTLDVTRVVRTWMKLAPDTWLQSDATVTEGGAIVLP